MLIGLAALPRAFAQDIQNAARNARGLGLVTGRVKNVATDTFLANAYVEIVGTSLHTLTQPDGSYSFAVPAGSYTVAVSYTGLNPERVAVTVGAGETAAQEINLTSDIYTMEKIVVKGLLEENASALQMQRYAPNPKTVTSTNAYGSPTGNPGELLQRIPGIATDITQGEVTSIFVRGMNVGFAGLMVNGHPVAVSLGALVGSSGQYSISELATVNLSEVEFVKAPTPDMDANNIAGSINLVSKRSFDRGRREIVLNLGTTATRRDWSDSPLKTGFRNLNSISLSYADVFGVLGGKNNLGVTIDLAEQSPVRVSDQAGPKSVNSLPGAYRNFASANPLTTTFALQEVGGTVKKRTGAINLDYKLSRTAYIDVKYAKTHMERRTPALYAYVTPTSSAAPGLFTADSTYKNSTIPTGFATATTRSQNSTRVSDTEQWSGGGSFKLWGDSATLDIKGNYSHALSYNPYFLSAQASFAGVGFNLDRNTGDGDFYPAFTQIGGADVTNAKSYILNAVNNTVTNGAPETLSGVRVDLKKYFHSAAPTYIKVGAKVAENDRSDQRFYDSATYLGPSGIMNAPSNTIESMVAHKFKITKAQYGPFAFLPLVTHRSQLAPLNQFTKTAAQAYSDLTGFNARPTSINQRIKSAYVSGHIDLGKLRILGGIRTETTRDKSRAWILNQTAAWGGNSVGGNSFNPADVAANIARAERAYVGESVGNNSYTGTFPGIHFIYEPLDGLITRFSYNKSISRPDVASILPTISANDVSRVITVGNPNLRPYLSNNFDFSVEKYYASSGLVSIGVFLKEIANYYRTFTTTVGPEGYNGSGNYVGYDQNISMNVGNARIRGLEMRFQQQFSFLPGPFRGLGTFANFTYTQGQGTFGTLINFGALAISPRVPFLTPRTINGGLSYVGHGFEARLMANYKSKTYQGGSGGVDFDSAERTWLDLKLRYAISKSYAVELNIANLTNSYENKWYSSDGRLPFGLIKPGTSYTLGVIAKF
ncbi:MAG: TonB-dependent receptor [Verrucomicrobia bacterium]|nr:TonB-dependent receptor [Verrucomicrobiota bacterium]